MINFICKHDTKIIAVAAISNVIIFIMIRLFLKKGEDIMRPKADRKHELAVKITLNRKQANKLQNCKDKLLSLYSAYANITAIFPLLGILGTVAALTASAGDADMMKSFQVALDTTVWGVVCAIVSKIVDSFISGKIDSFVDDSDFVIKKADSKGELIDEA